MTNREKLASMTDEELAEYLCKKTKCTNCVAFDYCKYQHTGYVDWLKAEAEESNE